MTKLNDEKETQVALKWLQKGLVNAHLSPNIKKEVKRLLAVDDFTSNMGYMEIFNPLQTFCKERLLEIGAPLQQMYQQDKTIQDLANLSPVLHPDLANHPTISHLRQDHPVVRLSSPFDHSNFNGESMYIHFIRLVALLINERYQEMVKNTVAPLGGDHKGCAIKGDSRMRNKALAKDDHRSEEKPRPAMNIDISLDLLPLDRVKVFLHSERFTTGRGWRRRRWKKMGKDGKRWKKKKKKIEYT